MLSKVLFIVIWNKSCSSIWAFQVFSTTLADKIVYWKLKTTRMFSNSDELYEKWRKPNGKTGGSY